MIWISRDLDFFVDAESPHIWAATVVICGVEYKRLSPRGFGMLYAHMRQRANANDLTIENVRKFTALEQTIHAIGRKEEYCAHVSTKT